MFMVTLNLVTGFLYSLILYNVGDFKITMATPFIFHSGNIDLSLLWWINYFVYPVVMGIKKILPVILIGF